MQCTNCGGRLTYAHGLYICEHCGSRQTISNFFENTEVFICYIECDGQGRRTRDSIIAQDIYTKLEATKIKTFYQRISAMELTGDNFVKGYREAFNKAKILLILGTTEEHFQRLIEKERNNFSGKKVIPIYSEIDAYSIPKELSSLQAMNYDGLGTVSDLTKRILQILGRETELEFAKTADKRSRRIKRITWICICIVLAIILAVSSYIVFGTHYVLKSKKYDYAAELAESGNFIEAMDVYATLGDYKNSYDLLKKIYDRYDGYYNSEDNTLSLYLNIHDKSAEIQFLQIDEKGRMARFDITALVEKNKITFAFADNYNNQGNCTIELFNEGITQTIQMEEEKELSISSQVISFDVTQKADAPISPSTDLDVLLSWLSVKTKKEDLFQKGYQLDNGSNGHFEGETNSISYKIRDTDIELTFSGQDDNLIGIVSSAQTLLPDRIGQSAVPFLEGAFLYVPQSWIFTSVHSVWLEGDPKTIILEKDTQICITSKSVVDVDTWSFLIGEVAGYAAWTDARKNFLVGIEYDLTGHHRCLAENNTHYLVGLDLLYSERKSRLYYKVDKELKNVQFIAELPYTTALEPYKAYPHLFGEFIFNTNSESNRDVTQ